MSLPFIVRETDPSPPHTFPCYVSMLRVTSWKVAFMSKGRQSPPISYLALTELSCSHLEFFCFFFHLHGYQNFSLILPRYEGGRFLFPTSSVLTRYFCCLCVTPSVICCWVSLAGRARAARSVAAEHGHVSGAFFYRCPRGGTTGVRPLAQSLIHASSARHPSVPTIQPIPITPLSFVRPSPHTFCF